MNTATGRRTSHAAHAVDWRAAAACKDADPDLFFPEPRASKKAIQAAKAVCARCPVKQRCLDEAFKANEWEAICGGLTPKEREKVLTPARAANLSAGRRRTMDNASARQLAVQRGSDLLVMLVKRQMSVPDVAELVNATPRAVFHAFLTLVPESPDNKRTNETLAIERVLGESQETLRTLQRIGRTHEEIGKAVGTSQSIVSACLSVLDQREDAMRRVSRKGPAESLRLIQAEETRIRRESRSGLTVEDVLAVAGPKIRELHAGGMGLRQVALELGLSRETVRKAYLQMTTPVRGAKDLTKSEMGAAA